MQAFYEKQCNQLSSISQRKYTQNPYQGSPEMRSPSIPPKNPLTRPRQQFLQQWMISVQPSLQTPI
ncbi:MAG: hypothetical protein ACFKPT_00470 [Gloeotrichia echinulata GP01]